MNRFFDQGTMIGNTGYCDNTTLSSEGGFGGTVDGLLKDLSTATPRMNGYFGAAKRGNVYGVAQCARTLSTSACEQCLNVAYGNINGCPPDGGGRSVDAGCFLRYSVASFFSDNQTTDLAPFLSSGEFVLFTMNSFKICIRQMLKYLWGCKFFLIIYIF